MFGSIISRLSSPELSLAAGSDALQFEQVPSDNREVEVLYALSVFGALAVWTLLQVRFCYLICLSTICSSDN